MRTSSTPLHAVLVHRIRAWVAFYYGHSYLYALWTLARAEHRNAARVSGRFENRHLPSNQTLDGVVISVG